MNFSISELPFPFRLRTASPWSDDALMRFSAENGLLRIEQDANGELIVMSPTGTGGGGMETEVALELGIWARQDGRGKVFGANAGFRLRDGSVRAADAAWLTWRQWNALSAEEKTKGYARACPEFVIEIRSESDRLIELKTKMELWLANGVEVGWLIDPKEKTVEIYRVGDSVEVLFGPSSVQGTGIVSGFELVMERVWG